jgi:hypothetical protein
MMLYLFGWFLSPQLAIRYFGMTGSAVWRQPAIVTTGSIALGQLISTHITDSEWHI